VKPKQQGFSKKIPNFETQTIPIFVKLKNSGKFGILQGLSLKQLSSTGMNKMNSFSNIIKVFQ
jgi:hypothetical protein